MKTTPKFVIYLFVLFFIWIVVIGARSGSSWSGEGSINVFPRDGEVKNYRLDSHIKVTIKSDSPLSEYKEFEIEQATWPNGGNLYFSRKCYVSKKSPRPKCISDDGTEYYIEVNEYPKASNSANGY